MKVFHYKISQGKQAQITNDFMIIGRIESLIHGSDLNGALKRAHAYIEAGADGIMIHSNEKTPQQILSFYQEYSQIEKRVPLVAISTKYNNLTETALKELGVNIVIYANQLLRSAYPIMKKTAETILLNGRSLEAEKKCISINDLLKLYA